MGLPKIKPKISIDNYLEGEKVSQIKHEYIDGEVYAMAGTSKNHNRIIGNLFEKLKAHLRGSDCEPFFVDIKVYSEKFNRFYYPDLIVVCGEDAESEYFTAKPKLIVEVLSPTTALTDRREKMFVYKELASVEEYILIEQNRMYAEIYRRRGFDNLWSWIEFETGEEIEFASVNFKMPMAEIYAGVELSEANNFERGIF
jgi:Uma2 family endonuclease